MGYMTISLHTGLKQSQKLVMTHALQQAVELLQMSSVELYEKISQELVENPVLEEAGPRPVTDQEGSDRESSINQNLNGGESFFIRRDEEQNNFIDAGDTGSVNSEDLEKKQKYFETITTREESLSEHLLSQARLTAKTVKQLDLYEAVITSLDHNGFLGHDFALPAKDGGKHDKEIARVLSAIQLFDPIGCAVSGVRESLVVQCHYYYPQDALLMRILAEHFEDFERLNYNTIARSLKLSESHIMGKVRAIHMLNPYPGRQYSDGITRYNIPDVDVKLVDGEIVVSLNDDWIPAIRINSYYINLIKKKNIERNSLNYIQDKIQNARIFLKNIAGRRNTIDRVVRSIMERQREFLLKGPGHLRPLTHREIARDADMHESTVSRATSNKYVQTSWGVYDLKYFFVSQIKKDGGNVHASSDKVMHLILDIVERENSIKPCSDEEIVTILGKAGVRVARRTVAKYRGTLNIPPSQKRKKINILKSEERT
jgi:RNA polymerase sigma-54 factor